MIITRRPAHSLNKTCHFETLAQYQVGDSHPYTYQRLPALPDTCAQASTALITDFRTNFEALWQSFNDDYPFFAEVTDIVKQGVVHCTHGWAEANINNLTDDAELDPISGFPRFKSALCEVQRSAKP